MFGERRRDVEIPPENRSGKKPAHSFTPYDYIKPAQRAEKKRILGENLF